MSEQALNLRARSRLGTVLRGKYTLEEVLGIGGMAVVYKARHRNQAEFAVKMLRTELSEDQELRTRFLREGYVANSVKHPGAVNVIDDDVSDDGIAFLVMELLRGTNCDSLIESSNNHVPPAIASAICVQMLDVLAAAHAKSILHRDLKPANLFVMKDGGVKLLDFGVARVRDMAAVAPSATQTGLTFGTPAFMAPEQARGETKTIDERTDIWAAGATLFSMITGRFVHDGENAAQITVKAATQPATPIQAVVPTVPKPLADVIDRALAFNPAQRWASAVAMREALIAAHRASFAQEPSPEIIATYVRLVAHRKKRQNPDTTRRLDEPDDRTTEPAGATTAQPVSSDKHTRSASSVLLVVGGAALAAMILFFVGLTFVPHFRDTKPVAATASTSAKPNIGTTESVPAPVVSITPLVPATTNARPAATIPIAGPTAATVPVRPTTTAKPSATATVKPGCDPPYTIDAQGNRHFKAECYE